MRVLHVIPSISPCYGGPSTAILPLVRALNSLEDVSTEIATTDANGPRTRIARQCLPEEPKIHLFHRSLSESWKVSLPLQWWLRQRVRSYDILHLHALWSFSTAAAARVAVSQGVPYIVRPAGMLSAYTWNRSSRKKLLYWRMVERRTVKMAAAFHATSDAEAEEVCAVRGDARVFIIPNGVEESALSTPPRKAFLRQRCGAAAGHLPIILFLSRLHPKKGIVDRLLPAIAAMRTPCFLAIAGGEDAHAPDYANAIRRTIASLGLQHRVGLLGRIAAEARWSLYDGADVLVLPSHSENFGIVVAESMARGCPVIISDAVQSCTHVDTAGAGMIVTGDQNVWADALDRMLAASEHRIRMGSAGKRYAQQHLCWSIIAQRVRDMYTTVLQPLTASAV